MSVLLGVVVVVRAVSSIIVWYGRVSFCFVPSLVGWGGGGGAKETACGRKQRYSDMAKLPGRAGSRAAGSINKPTGRGNHGKSGGIFPPMVWWHFWH